LFSRLFFCPPIQVDLRAFRAGTQLAEARVVSHEKETTMIRPTQTLPTLFLFAAIAAGAGCATTAGGGARDIHASATVGGVGPRMLTAGPALLIHVDVEGKNDLALYTVARKLGTDADCAASPAGQSVRLRGGVSNHVNVTLNGDEAVCVAPQAGHAAILWHVKTPGAPRTPAGAETLAMGLGTH
jgi:hypothetical protein